MPTYLYSEITLDEVLARIRTKIPEPRPVGIQVGNDKILMVDLPDATQTEFDDVMEDLRATWPKQMNFGDATQAVFFITDAAAQAWTNQPAALTEFRGLTVFRQYANLETVSRIRLIARVETAGAPGSELRLQYSTDGNTWNYLSGTDSPKVSIAAVGLIQGAEVTIAAAARKAVQLRLVGINGNGTADPAFGTIEAIAK
jgi:hypothetical protein